MVLAARFSIYLSIYLPFSAFSCLLWPKTRAWPMAMVRRTALLLVSAQLALSVPPTQLYSGDRSSITGPAVDHDHDDGVGSLLAKMLHSGAAPARVSLGTDNQTQLARGVFDYIAGTADQFLCTAPSVEQACPAIAATSETRSVSELAVPADARWLFEGPSYMTEIFLTLAAVNGGCTGERLHDHQGMLRRKLKKYPAVYSVCNLPNGAVLAHSGGEATTTAAIESEEWTHAFFMNAHGEEYDAEHAAAAQEGRDPDPARMRDAVGRDMCLPASLGADCCGSDGTCCSSPARDVGFADYMDCDATLGSGERFRLQMGSVKVTRVVPWHLRQPEEPAREKGGSMPLFTDQRVADLDCKTDLQAVGATGDGFKAYGVSRAAVNPKNADGTPLLAYHQCIVVCDPEACHLGSMVWVAHDLVLRARKTE